MFYFLSNSFSRHVILSQELVERLPKPLRLLSEKEWRELGIEGGHGWEHYAIHKPEPHILLFRRLLATSPNPPPEAILAK